MKKIELEKWKKRNEERYKSMLNRIFGSDFSEEWKKQMEEDKEEEVEFYGRELTEQERKVDLLDEFFEQPLKDIVSVLPEIWEEIKEEIKDNLWEVLKSPDSLEEHIGGSTFYETVDVPFRLSRYLGELQDDLYKTLKKQYEKGEKP